MGVPDVMSALKAGQDTGRLPQLSEGASVEALLNALAYDSLGVSAVQCGLCSTQHNREKYTTV